MVVKPSEETPSTATLLGEVMNKVGVPRGVYNVLHGFGPGSAGEFLTRHQGVDAITFTGETRTGTAIMKAAAEGTRGVSFELGGKNAGLVFADCDFDAAVDGIARAAFANCGQVCLGTERVYVERPIFEKFVQALKKKAEGMKAGPPEDAATGIGPLISQEHRSKVLSYYKKAVADGATVVTGGGVPDMPGELRNGSWIQPTIWTGLAEDSAVIREEIFGPCCHIRPFDAEDEAIRSRTTRPTGWRPRSGRRTSRARTASRRRSTWASAGSTAGSCAICARRSAARRNPASAARAACTRSSSTPSSGTSASSCNRAPSPAAEPAPLQIAAARRSGRLRRAT